MRRDQGEQIMVPVDRDSPLMRAWNDYKGTEDYRNALRWLASGNFEGELWAAFARGFAAGSLKPVTHELEQAAERGRPFDLPYKDCL